MTSFISRGRTEDGAPNPVDVYVGARMRSRRQILGLSQEKLGDLLGLTFQQIQKYERGMNRIGASRLWDIAKVLEVELEFFFADMPADIARQSPRGLTIGQNMPKKETKPADPMSKTETLLLVGAYYKIKPEKLRTEFLTLVKLISAGNYSPTEE